MSSGRGLAIREKIIAKGHRIGPQWLCAYCWLDKFYEWKDRDDE